MSLKSAKDQIDAIFSSAAKSQVSTASDTRHSFHSATTQQMSETNSTQINGISTTNELLFDNQMTPDIKELSNKKKDKRNKTNDWKFLTFDYQFNEWSDEDLIQPLSKLSVPEQESALIEDLLFVLIVRIDYLFNFSIILNQLLGNRRKIHSFASIERQTQ